MTNNFTDMKNLKIRITTFKTPFLVLVDLIWGTSLYRQNIHSLTLDYFSKTLYEDHPRNPTTSLKTPFLWTNFKFSYLIFTHYKDNPKKDH